MFGWKNTSVVVELVKDPICGMAVDPSKAYYTEVGKGKKYYFCGAGCKATFKRAINKTLSSIPREAHKASKKSAECCH